MSWLRQAFIDVNVRLRSLFGRRRMRARMDEEMRAHVEMREARLVAGGASQAHARRQARREFGNIAALCDSAADMWKYGTIERLLQDVRYGARTLSRTPGFTFIAVTILSLGIGINATVFTVASSYFLEPLPVADSSQVVRVYSNRWSNTSQYAYRELRDRTSTLEGLAAFQMISAGLLVDREVEHAFGQIVSGNYFSLLGVSAVRGRPISADDDTPGAAPVVMLSHAFWQYRFASSPDVVGRTVSLNDRVFTIIGVSQPGFTGAMAPLKGDFWLPLSADAYLRPALGAEGRAESLTLHMLGRLKPGVTILRAQVDLDTIGRQLRAAEDSTNPNQAVSVYGATILHPEIAGPIGLFVTVLTVIVALVLLTVCFNVANLVLARSASRDIELAIRQSIGAGRGRLIRQLLTENFLLSLAGAAGGLAIAYWLTHLLNAAVPQMPVPVPLVMDVAIDWRVLAFIMLVVAGATLTFGTMPAMSASRLDLVRVLKGVGGQDRGHARARAGFLIAQVSISVLLLVTAGLFILALRSMQTVETGFDGHPVLTASIDLEARGYTADRGRDFLRRLTERLDASPGVLSSNVVDFLPLTLSNRANYLLRTGDAVSPDTRRPPMPIVYMNSVGPGHFKTLQIGLTAGRDFTVNDTEGAPLVVIVNETLARRFWPGQAALGQQLRLIGEDRQVFQVVGVVRDSKYVAVGEDTRPFMYQSFAQFYKPQPTVLVRAAGAAESVVPVIQQVVRSMDAGLPVFNVATMDNATSISLLPSKVAGRLLAILGALALALSALGTFGVLSFLVRSRARELAIRLAVGATPRDVAGLVVGQALTWTGVGTVIGLALAFALTRFLSTFLHGVNPADPGVFGGVAGLIVLVACAAAVVPALRASRQDPLVTLRDA